MGRLVALLWLLGVAVVAGSPLPSLGRGMWVRGGSTAGNEDFGLQCDKTLREALDNAQKGVADLALEIESGSCVADLGSKSDAIVNQALEAFTSKAPSANAGSGQEKIYDEKVEELEKSLDAPLRVLYMKQLLLLRDKALKRYKSAAKNSESSDYEAMVAADQFFNEEAEASTRRASDWDFSKERASLQSTMNEIARAKKRLTDTRLQAAKSQQEIMRLLQVQHNQIQQLQAAAYGTASPWNLGVAYRIPDTNINLSAGHQQGRTNVQLSCVPDESAALLGPNGFTRGVGPGNLGVSLSLTV
mmetsp:Transcript_17271/g.50362  ORF Transcript_17271/g.50362 Transcript_17271/m.50362 type:complete len:302 (-) Transcript_17271:171-1076(-)